ncbi:hypothetical protein PIB30_020139 [Stylosanthes scabra]|uniref:GPI ethanolamine phosphate transferase 3 n=1 Tax=Stylosanthes scabra TaxID=79078 RepID=A0ABU6Y8R5_9FABA|nr:hypothetical protein [Stylosanthes scabra]
MKDREVATRRRKVTGKWEYTWHLWATLLLHIIAIVLFTRGFLLTRTELPYYSNSSDVSESQCVYSSSHNNASSWTKPAVNRLIIIVLDALRFDFVAPSTFFPESKRWMDKLEVLKDVVSKNPTSARIFKAIADPPTTSLQRLKGLTTGGLPTFVDVGNSFGAPAIVEDNFLNQVDNGCIEHLFPSLYEDDWDVLISHFLGVDHAGHIFGVDSTPMIEKLEQYNSILEKVIEVLEKESGPGSLHENTLLVVMGDHGQTLNGDHGGGGAEEVETAIFAMSVKKPPSSVPVEYDTSSCQLDLDGKNVCVSTMQQLDFAATMSALLGIPFPYGSIGQVNPELYALGAGSWNSDASQELSESDIWMQNYANTLCINSWQVKRYIDAYSASSAVGFSSDDLSQVASVYAQAETQWLCSTKKLLLDKNKGTDALVPALKKQIEAYFNFLRTVAELARSKWTEFDLYMMGTGIAIMSISLIFQVLVILRANSQDGATLASSGYGWIFSASTFAFFLLGMRAVSFLSNSFILEEGKVAIFLLSTSGIVALRKSVVKGELLKESVGFLLLCTFCRFGIEIGLSKQSATSAFMKEYTSWILNIASDLPVWNHAAEVVPILVLILLAFWLYKATSGIFFGWTRKIVILCTILTYILIIVHWITENNRYVLAFMPESIGRTYIPRIIYAILLGQLLLLAFAQLFKGNCSDCKTNLVAKTTAMLAAWSSTIILLSGKQGPAVAFASIIGGYCIMRLCDIEDENGPKRSLSIGPFPVMQWNLFATCLFFCSGHWCAFDGLHYGAAFIGFEEFMLIPQAIILTLDTYGFSIILPIFGLPFLVATKYKADLGKHVLFRQLSQIYTTYGLITAIMTMFTIFCVTLHRRHLMVWGLFAPKFVFDVFGLILTDILICLASLYYFDQGKDDHHHN